jgi:hypothetical protein
MEEERAVRGYGREVECLETPSTMA